MSGTGDDGRVDGATTRRTVLRAGAGASLGLLSPWAYGVAAGQGAAEPHVRREIHGLAPEGPEIAALRRGIAAMKARPATDPTSWLFQANIHGTDDNVPARFASVWNSCQHGSHFFLSWHRLYLYFFERILRAASGSSTFALPYWDYSVAARRRLPAVFRDPASAANPLYVSDRRRSVNAGEPLPASATSATQAMATIPFASPPGSGASFGGQALDEAAHFTGPHGRLESQPHDVMHVALGGNGWMSDPNLAARDPIFWLHHCNIDRLWTRWLALGGGRRNPGSGPWTTTRFTFFDEQKREVIMTGSDVIEHERQLGYRYDDGPSPRPAPAGEGPGATEAAARPPRVLAAFRPATEAALALGTRDTTVALQPTADRAVESAVEAAAAPTAGASAIELSFDDIARRPLVGLYYEVYLNKPADAPFDADGPYFAGTLAFFADGHAHGAAGRLTGLRKALPVGSVLAAQRSGGRWSGGEVRVELHPVGAEDATEAAGAPLVTVGRIQLIQP